MSLQLFFFLERTVKGRMDFGLARDVGCLTRCIGS